ncbi:MAG: cysteine hydrolase [Roseivirga sp.]|nr:cysteine hydrolase [Roseivirga sp.]
MSKKALLIIDMQQGDFPPVKPRYQAELTIETIAQLVANFRSLDQPVVYIQHDGSAESVFMPGTSDWEIVSELTPRPADIIVSKSANNAFYRSELDELLKQLKVNELFVTGSATDFCVNATVQAGLSLDYQITVIANAHTTADRPKLGAQQVIDHYNWVWDNMTPTQGSIRVLNTKEIDLD